jgi:hypothetical protein
MTADLTHATALTVTCPRCHVGAGYPCRSVRGPMRGRVKAFTHKARRRAAS